MTVRRTDGRTVTDGPASRGKTESDERVRTLVRQGKN